MEGWTSRSWSSTRSYPGDPMNVRKMSMVAFTADISGRKWMATSPWPDVLNPIISKFGTLNWNVSKPSIIFKFHPAYQDIVKHLTSVDSVLLSFILLMLWLGFTVKITSNLNFQTKHYFFVSWERCFLISLLRFNSEVEIWMVQCSKWKTEKLKEFFQSLDKQFLMKEMEHFKCSKMAS